MLSPPSGLKNKPSKKLALLSTGFHADIFLGLLFNPEDGGDTFLQNVG
jgi:hypothetical protein